MDRDVNERLGRARSRATERAAVDARLGTIRRQITDRRAILAGLDERLRGEEADVRALEGLSLAAMFATMLGRKAARLAAERAEVLHAKLARDAGATALQSLEADATPLEARLAELGDVASELAAALAAKEADLVARGDPVARRLAEMDAALDDARAVSKEIQEAIDAADEALRTIGRVSASLDSARNWGTFDMLGGGMMATWAKHSRIDEARTEAHAAQAALDRLARELADVRGGAASSPLVVEIGEFSKFADYFLDGLFADWAVQSRITTSCDNVASARRSVDSVRDRLYAQLRAILLESESLAAERARVVENA